MTLIVRDFAYTTVLCIAPVHVRRRPVKRDNRKHTVKTASMKRKYKNGGM